MKISRLLGTTVAALIPLVVHQERPTDILEMQQEIRDEELYCSLDASGKVLGSYKGVKFIVGKSAVVYESEGAAQLCVELSKVRIEKDGDRIIVSLPQPKVRQARILPGKTKRVYGDFSCLLSDDERASIQDALERKMEREFESTAYTAISRARRNTEMFVASLLRSGWGDAPVVFRWEQ